jgi:hypothetical protein
MKDVKTYLKSLLIKYANESIPANEAMKVITDRLRLIDSGKDRFKVEDVIILMNVLKNDVQLNQYFVEYDKDYGEKGKVNNCTDIGCDVRQMFPDYNDDDLESVQGIMQNFGSHLCNAIAGMVWEGNNPTGVYAISSENLYKLAKEGLSPIITFSPLSDDETGFYPNISFELENFFVIL